MKHVNFTVVMRRPLDKLLVRQTDQIALFFQILHPGVASFRYRQSGKSGYRHGKYRPPAVALPSQCPDRAGDECRAQMRQAAYQRPQFNQRRHGRGHFICRLRQSLRPDESPQPITHRIQPRIGGTDRALRAKFYRSYGASKLVQDVPARFIGGQGY